MQLSQLSLLISLCFKWVTTFQISGKLSNKSASLSAIFNNGTSALQFVQLFRFASLLLTGVVLAQMGVASNLIGIYETLIFISSAVSFFWLNGFMQNMLIQYAKTDNKKALLQNTFWWLMVFRLPITLLYLAFIFILYPDLAAGEYRQPMLLFGIVIFIAGTAVMMEYVLLLEQRLNWLVVYSVLHYTAHIVAVAAAFAWGNGIEHCVYGLIALNLLRFVLLVTVVFGKKIYIPKKQTFYNLIAGASPLIVAALFSGSVEYISGFFVSGFMGESDFALYRYGAKELPLTLLLANAFSAALIPQIAEAGKEWRNGLRPIKQASATHIGILFPFCAVLMVASPFIYPTVFNPEFAASASVFNIFLLLVISRFVFPQSILLGLGYRRAIVQGSILELSTAIVLGLALGYVWGINGVAMSVVIASFAEKAYLIYRVKKIEKIAPSQYIPLKTWAICSLGLVAIYAATHFWFFT